MAVQKNHDQKYPRLRAFCAAAMLTFCLLLLGMGFLIADYNTRRVGFAEGSLRLDVTAQEDTVMLNVLGREMAVEVPETVQVWAGRVWTLIPAGWRAVFWIFESECEVAPEVLELAGAG